MCVEKLLNRYQWPLSKTELQFDPSSLLNHFIKNVQIKYSNILQIFEAIAKISSAKATNARNDEKIQQILKLSATA